MEGSGSDADSPPTPSSNKNNIYNPASPAPWPRNRPLPMPPTPSYGRPYYAQPSPPSTTPEEVDRTILFTSRPIPPAIVAYPGSRQYQQPRASPPPRPTGRPVIVDVPKPSIPHHNQNQNKDKERSKHGVKPTVTTHTTYSKSSADRTALIIGLIAVILIVIVIIAPIIVFIKVKYRSNGTCKTIDDRTLNKNYQFAPVSGMPQMLANANGSGSMNHLTGSVAGTMPRGQPPGEYKQAPKLPNKKDLKEWYV